MNFVQVYNELEVSRTFYRFSGNFSLLCDCWTSTKMFLVNLVKSLTHKKHFQYFLHFSSYSQLATRLCSVFNKLPSDLACLLTSRRSGIFQNFIFWNYQRYSILYFIACIQLVKVSTVFIFLERGLLLKDSVSPKDQYLFEIFLVEHSGQVCHQITIACVSSYPSQFTACLS